MKLNLGAGKVPKPKAEGWVNLDKFEYPSTAEFEYRKLDLFRFPWDIPDNSVDEVYASHIIEHIPHEPKPSILTQDLNEGIFKGLSLKEAVGLAQKQRAEHADRWEQLESLDGFFCFFAEVWRICKPDALVDIVCPFGYTRGAFQDPTHTRYIVPPTFSYLDTTENPNWNYHLPLQFKLLKCNVSAAEVYAMVVDKDQPVEEYNQKRGQNLTAEQYTELLSIGMSQSEFDFNSMHQWDYYRDLVAQLQVIKA